MSKCKDNILITVVIAMASIFFHSVAFSEDVDRTWEDKYKSEPYIRLLKEVVIKLNKDNAYTTTTHTIDKIQQEGGKSQGEITLDYDKERQEITDIEAYTIMSDGAKLRYEKLQDRNKPGSFGVYNDDREKVITMPNVVVGSIIDSKSTTKTKKNIIYNNFFDSFRFSCYCPVKEARYKITAPKDMKLNFKSLNNEIQPKIEVSGDEVTYTWESFNNDKDDTEEFMPSPEERFKRITVSSLADWKGFSGWAWSLFQQNLISLPAIKTKVQELAANKKTLTDKVQAVIEYLRTDFRYVAMHIESHGYEPHPADEVFTNKYGDCKDQTLLAITMLSELGVKAWPVFMSTESELRRRDLLPMPFYFDHVILYFELDGNSYFTDVLLKGYHFRDISILLAGKGAFIVNDHGGLFTTIPLADKSETSIVGNSKTLIRENGSVSVDAEVTFPKGYSAMLREAFKTVGDGEKEKLYAALETGIAQGGKVLKREMRNEALPYSQLSFALHFEHPSLVQRMGDRMIFGLPQVPRGIEFSAPKRRYPIVFLNEGEVESNISYTIPESYEVESLPKKVALNTTFAAFTREYVVEANKINIKQVVSTKRAHLTV